LLPKIATFGFGWTVLPEQFVLLAAAPENSGQHFWRDVARDRHDGLMAGLGLGKLSYCMMPWNF
jgi:hypothetical protein